MCVQHGRIYTRPWKIGGSVVPKDRRCAFLCVGRRQIRTCCSHTRRATASGTRGRVRCGTAPRARPGPGACVPARRPAHTRASSRRALPIKSAVRRGPGAWWPRGPEAHGVRKQRGLGAGYWRATSGLVVRGRASAGRVGWHSAIGSLVGCLPVPHPADWSRCNPRKSVSAR